VYAISVFFVTSFITLKSTPHKEVKGEVRHNAEQTSFHTIADEKLGIKNRIYAFQ
jgi:hypothetical protein